MEISTAQKKPVQLFNRFENLKKIFWDSIF
jgi:hypothetical protein